MPVSNSRYVPEADVCEQLEVYLCEQLEVDACEQLEIDVCEQLAAGATRATPFLCF